MTTEHKDRISRSKRGASNPMWNGGSSAEHKRIWGTREYREWRKAVFERDGYACVLGGKAHGKRLNADHIKPFATYLQLRFVVANGRTLCVPCHRKTPTYGVKKKYAEKSN